jgi:hypothetical protein
MILASGTGKGARANPEFAPPAPGRRIERSSMAAGHTL